MSYSYFNGCKHRCVSVYQTCTGEHANAPSCGSFSEWGKRQSGDGARGASTGRRTAGTREQWAEGIQRHGTRATRGPHSGRPPHRGMRWATENSLACCRASLPDGSGGDVCVSRPVEILNPHASRAPHSEREQENTTGMTLSQVLTEIAHAVGYTQAFA